MRTAVLAVLVLAASACDVARWLQGPCVERRHSSGIALVCPEDIEPWRTAAEELKGAHAAAREIADAHPEAFGYPTLDFASESVVIRVVRPEGETLARAWIASGTTIQTPKEPRVLERPAVPVRLEPATRSVAELDEVQHAVGPGLAGAPDSNLIYAAGRDIKRNAVRYVVERESDALLVALAAKFGTEAIVVEVNPLRPPVGY